MIKDGPKTIPIHMVGFHSVSKIGSLELLKARFPIKGKEKTRKGKAMIQLMKMKHVHG